MNGHNLSRYHITCSHILLFNTFLLRVLCTWHICGLMVIVAGVDRNMETKNATPLMCRKFVVYNIHSKSLLIISVDSNYCVYVRRVSRSVTLGCGRKFSLCTTAFEIHDDVSVYRMFID